MKKHTLASAAGLLALLFTATIASSQTNDAASSGPAVNTAAAPESSGPTGPLARNPPVPATAVPAAAAAAPKKNAVPREARAALASMAGSRRAHRPPAVALSGPAGTKVTVDDTLEWTSPGPAGGMDLFPGLVNITLTPPGSHRPISSSLFISEDTLYLLNLEADGGFSVNRKWR